MLLILSLICFFCYSKYSCNVCCINSSIFCPNISFISSLMDSFNSFNFVLIYFILSFLLVPVKGGNSVVVFFFNAAKLSLVLGVLLGSDNVMLFNAFSNSCSFFSKSSNIFFSCCVKFRYVGLVVLNSSNLWFCSGEKKFA
ncbi:hypothetical protein [Candidatus Phytoplasma asteris]|uniref:Uncharacterized protein n=2 Tax=16SrI (Aster yellows group) TaxID=3042590 RepID=A0A859I9S4_9MOLU|nr:MAG: hypothetical protein RP166_2740 [Rapeseed phyllody phytoplasma]